MSDQDQYWMQQALLLADQAESLEEVPVGALLVLNDEVIGRGYNQPITTNDPTAHAEIIALRDAAKHLGNYRLVGATLYVTIEPCTMCAGAIIHSRISRLVYGATEPKAGAISSCSQLLDADYVNYKVDYLGGVCADECSQKISDFFSKRRRQKKEK
ncbi:MAG: tRNA adenosine(34) deaminase TadA [Cellvibrionaceae bacterium]